MIIRELADFTAGYTYAEGALVYHYPDQHLTSYPWMYQNSEVSLLNASGLGWGGPGAYGIDASWALIPMQRAGARRFNARLWVNDKSGYSESGLLLRAATPGETLGKYLFVGFHGGEFGLWDSGYTNLLAGILIGNLPAGSGLTAFPNEVVPEAWYADLEVVDQLEKFTIKLNGLVVFSLKNITQYVDNQCIGVMFGDWIGSFGAVNSLTVDLGLAADFDEQPSGTFQTSADFIEGPVAQVMRISTGNDTSETEVIMTLNGIVILDTELSEPDTAYWNYLWHLFVGVINGNDDEIPEAYRVVSGTRVIDAAHGLIHLPSHDVVIPRHGQPVHATLDPADARTNPLGEWYPQYPVVVVTSTVPGVAFTLTLQDIYEGNVALYRRNTVHTAYVQHANYALDRLLYQYKNAVNLKAIVANLAGQSQGEEDALQDIMSYEYLPIAVGEQLDGYGKLLGVSRGTLADDAYRNMIYLKIFENFSEGTAEDLIHIFGSFTRAAQVVVMELIPATISLFAVDANEPDVSAARAAVEACKAAAVAIDSLGLIFTPPLAFYEDPDPTGVGLDDGSGTVGGYLAASF